MGCMLTYSHLQHYLPNSFKAAAISSLHLLKSILEGNWYEFQSFRNYISDSKIRNYF